MNRVPLVSVLTPSYNQARWLLDNLLSVASQSYPRIEHIIRDGGSTDGSPDLLASLAGPNVKWVTQKDKGQSNAINQALADSSGEIIGWLNSDDAYFTREAVARAVGVFAARPDVDVVYGHAAVVNADGLLLQLVWAPRFSYRLLRIHTFIIQPAAFIRRSAIGAYLADEHYDYAMDRELWLRLGQTHNFARVNDILAINRHHAGRKGVARLDLARLDASRLTSEYQLPNRRLIRKAVKIATRLAGLQLVPRASKCELAFKGAVDSEWRLAIRQVAVKRAAMPGANGDRRGLIAESRT